MLLLRVGFFNFHWQKFDLNLLLHYNVLPKNSVNIKGKKVSFFELYFLFLEFWFYMNDPSKCPA